MNTSPIPPFIGSNSWVISGDKTESGKVLFANDPHIGFSQPSIWFEAHIVTPNHEIYGYFLPNIPFPLLGHNREHAYGLTMFENDDIDFYKEENHPTDPNKYKTPTGYDSYVLTSKTIKIKEEENLVFNYKSSRHGPIVNDVLGTINESAPVALSWIYTQFENKLIEAVHKMSKASSKEEFKDQPKPEFNKKKRFPGKDKKTNKPYPGVGGCAMVPLYIIEKEDDDVEDILHIEDQEDIV